MIQGLGNPYHSMADFQDFEGLFLSYDSLQKRGSRIRLDQNLLRQSAELAVKSYGKHIDELYGWGFVDISYYDNNRLNSVEPPLPNILKAGPLEYIKRLGNLRLPRSKGPLRAIFSAKKDEKREKYIISIAIAGTIFTLADWQVNMDMDSEAGYHKGYYKVSELLFSLFPTVQFPSVAKELALESLSLADIIEECQREDSRFLLWICGHSKGAALTQILVARLQNEHAVQNMIGVGLASPRVATRDTQNVSNYPIVNLIVKSDLVGKMAGSYSLGLNLEFPLARKQLYFDPKSYAENKERIASYWKLFPLITDPGSYLSFAYAMAGYLMHRRANGILEYFRMLYGDEPKDLLPGKFLENTRARYETWHRNIVGKPIDKALERAFLLAFHTNFDHVPLTKSMPAYMMASNAPHALMRDHTMAPYTYIVRKLPKFAVYNFRPHKKYLENRVTFAEHAPALRTIKKKKRKTFTTGKLC